MELTVLSMLLKLTLAGSVAVAVILLLRFVFKARLPKAFVVWLWFLALAAFVIPVSLPMPSFMSGIYSGFKTISVANVAVTPQSSQQAKSKSASGKSPVKINPKQPQNHSVPVKASKALNPYTIAVTLWGGISAILIILLSLLYYMTVRRFKNMQPVQDNDRYKALRGAVRVRRKVSLWLSANTSIPLTVGIIRPKIVLPTDFNLDNGRTTGHIYVHELIHVKRRDNAVSLIALFIACLHWFNPFVWAAYLMLCRDMELACDSRAVKVFGYQERAGYAESLLAIADRKTKLQPLFAAAFGKYDIKERVTNVMSTRKLTSKIIAACTISAIIVGISLTAVSCAKTEQKAASNGAASSSVQSSSGSSASAADEKDITTEANKKLFGDYAYNYYALMGMSYSGSIESKDMGDKMLRCSLNTGAADSVSKYMDLLNTNKQSTVAIPENLVDQMIKAHFEINTVDSSKITCFDSSKKEYVISQDMLGYDAYVSYVISSIRQKGDTIVVAADFYNPDEGNVDKNGNEKPNYNSKLASMKLTLKKITLTNGNAGYLYKNVDFKPASKG